MRRAELFRRAPAFLCWNDDVSILNKEPLPRPPSLFLRETETLIPVCTVSCRQHDSCSLCRCLARVHCVGVWCMSTVSVAAILCSTSARTSAPRKLGAKEEVGTNRPTRVRE